MQDHSFRINKVQFREHHNIQPLAARHIVVVVHATLLFVWLYVHVFDVVVAEILCVLYIIKFL